MLNKIKLWNYIYPLVSLLIIVVIWAICASVVNYEFIFPSIKTTLTKFIELFKDKEFYLRVFNTLLRSFISFAMSFILAFSFAICASISKKFKDVFSVFVILARAVPTMSFILIALMWLTTYQVPILVATVVTFPIMYTSFLGSIDGVDKKLIEMANVYKIKKTKQIKMLYLPEMADSIFTTTKTTLSFSIKLVIAAEVLAQTKTSMGVAMNNARLYLEMGELFAWTIIAIILGAIFEGLVLLIQKAVVKKW